MWESQESKRCRDYTSKWFDECRKMLAEDRKDNNIKDKTLVDGEYVNLQKAKFIYIHGYKKKLTLEQCFCRWGIINDSRCYSDF